MHTPGHDPRHDRFLLGAIALVLAGYLVAAAAGLPQEATKSLQQAGPGHAPLAAAAHPVPCPSYGTSLPFVLLLLGIAVLPLLPATAAWWESNPHRFYFSAALAAATLAYYLFWRTFPLESEWPAPHVVLPAVRGPNFALAGDVLLRAVVGEYGPFILLLFSLYTISGGIRIAGEVPAHPRTNTLFLAVGAVLASLIGTTGAAMLLIRPLLEVNRQRRHVAHTVVFFIFIVCNCGGCLLPIGDPPLFLGYLLGVSFFWTLSLWREWAFVNLALLALYYLLDRFWYYAREPAAAIAHDETRVHRFRFRGLGLNVPLLAATVACVALLDPAKTLPGTPWHPWLYLREMTLLGLVAASLLLGSHETRRANSFSYGAIIEVAALFFGIFLSHAAGAGDPPPEGAGTGARPAGAFLLGHGHALFGPGQRPHLRRLLCRGPSRSAAARRPRGGVAAPLLAAISLGAVFLGAMTYIGNGPNFMVRAVAQRAGVRMPGFFGYMAYSCLILLPLLVLTAGAVSARRTGGR